MSDNGVYLDELRLSAEPARREALKARIHSRAVERLADGQGRLADGALPRMSRFSSTRTRWGWTAIFLQIAAVLLVALLWRPNVEDFRDLLTGSSADEYVTTTSERIKLTLKDGTSVTLGENSRLKVISSPENDARELYLEGFALLDVAHDPTRPFIVRTPTTTTRVVGTRFVIRAYSEEKATSVAVAEGRVAVVPDATEGLTGVLLTRGQVGRLGVDGMVEVEQDESEVDRLVRLAYGPLAFTDMRLSAVLNEMEELYPVQFTVQDSALAHQLLTVRLPGDQMNDVVEAIALAVGARYENVADTVRFYPQ